MSWIFKEAPPSPPDPKAARTRAILLSAPFALMGLFALVLLVHDGLMGGGLDKQKKMGLLSAMIVGIGFPIFIFGINAKKNALNAARFKSPNPESPEKPWLNREDWAAGRVTSSSRGTAVFLWIFAAFWNVISAVIAFAVVPQELHRGNHAVLMVLIFPVIGMAMLTYAFNSTRAWRRYG